MRVPAGTSGEPERQAHPGHDWFSVLTGTGRLVLRGREHVVAAGEAGVVQHHDAARDGRRRGRAEVLTILDHHGERAHLD